MPSAGTTGGTLATYGLLNGEAAAMSISPTPPPAAAKPGTPALTQNYSNFYYMNGAMVGSVEQRRKYDAFNNPIGLTGNSNFDTTGVTSSVSAGAIQSDGTQADASINGGRAGAISYVVQRYDTLRGIARAVYGDETLWFVIAEANALPGNVTPPAGSVIELPAITRSSNTANTFQVFNPAEAIGDVSPAQVVPPPPPSKGGCGALGMIIMIVVAVVVTVVTAGAAAAAMGATATTATGVGASTAALGGAAVTGGAAAAASGITLGAATGTVAASMGMTATLAASAAVGAAVGSVASQLVGMAIGAQDKFSWKQVGLSALGAGVTSGLGAAAGVGAPGFASANPYLSAAASAAVRSTVTQGLGSALGMQSFSWRAVAVSALAAPLSVKLGEWADLGMAKAGIDNAIARDFGRAIVAGAATQRVRMAVYNNGKMDWAHLAADAFGNAMGNSLVKQLATQPNGAVFNWDDADRVVERSQPTASAPDNNPVVVAQLDPVAEQRSVYGADGSGQAFDGETGGRTRTYGAYNVQRGDTWSKIVGSNPAEIGLAMVLNDRRTSSLFAGETVRTGSLSDYTDSEIEQFKQLGLATLKQDNARIAALAEARLQAENASEIRRFQNSALADQNARYAAVSARSAIEAATHTPLVSGLSPEFGGDGTGRAFDDPDGGRRFALGLAVGLPKALVNSVPEFVTEAVKGWGLIGTTVGQATGLISSDTAARWSDSLRSLDGRIFEYRTPEEEGAALLTGVFGGQVAGVAASVRSLGSVAPNSAGQLATRERVLANIEATRAGNATSRFEVHLARTDQIRWGYAPDSWSMTTLNAGDRVFGGLPGQSSYYTSAATLEASGGSRATLFQSLQVKPHPEFGYRPKVGEYEVVRPITVPAGVAGANPGLGAGTGEQFFVRNYQNSLRLIREIPLGQ